MSERNYILDQESAARKMERMALELAETLNGDTTPILILGIRNSGWAVASNIMGYLRQYVPNDVQIKALSLNKEAPADVEIEGDVDMNDIHVVLVDDVTNSGRTLLYALKPILQYRPKSIQTMVLVERTHKHFPIKPDYVGLSVSTTLQDHIQVEVAGDAIKGAYMS